MSWSVEGDDGTASVRAAGTPLVERSVVFALVALVRFMLPAYAPPSLSAISAKAMSNGREDLYPDVDAVLREVERFQDGLAVEAYVESTWQRVRRFARRNEVLLWLLAAYAGVRFFLFFVRSF